MKGVFFDFWGTLIDNGVRPSPVKQVKEFLGIRMPFPDYIVRFEDAFMTKEFENLYEAFTEVCEDFDIKPDKKVLDKLVGMWNKNSLLCKPYPETLDVLEDLKKDFKIGLISNTPPSIRSVIEKYEMNRYFDSITLSCEKGMLKTDPRMFEIALKDIGLKKDKVIMVGDSLPTDIKGAEDAGVKAVLIDRRDSREYKNKIISLNEVRGYLE